ncbi:MAG: bifunctional phosphopantothenoylcysteine decarboxylase/phosphopantothenate--cysteine ligase CoaBC [Firmicutes bacterium HGW-Firmicutes-13]|nr:MAG: bifunctional phosphopantothenoylcysteine decarboxylase/phosphopantothenate--cysteine ligase CoaBC [Firmicutes bacterium HGW-Firmicutes-13]
MLKGKTVVLGITGSIAAYKGAEICRLLIKSGFKVRVIMTEGAEAFINPLTFETLSGGPVGTALFNRPHSWEIQHVSWAKEADLILVAPATANVVGKIAGGIADDLLTATIMAAEAPVIIAPAMNKGMYINPIFQDNMDKLRAKGYEFVEAESGFLACGDEGKGRLAEPQKVVDFVLSRIGREKDLTGQKIMITAGPTREPLDPVRYISNHSSGKMGYALAEAACQRGGQVTLISGPTCLTPPFGINFISIGTAEEMRDRVLKEFPGSDIVIKAAAVADYRPVNISEQKIKKKEGGLSLELEKTPDILAELGEIKENQILVGFAAETQQLRKNAVKKLKTKNLDLIVANDINQPGAGFNVDTNIVKIINSREDILELPLMTKRALADKILDLILEIKKST